MAENLPGVFGFLKQLETALTTPRGYKTFFMLNSAEREIFHTNKSQITNNCQFFLA